MEAGYAQLRVTLGQQERQITECDAALDLVTHVRAELTPADLDELTQALSS